MLRPLFQIYWAQLHSSRGWSDHYYFSREKQSVNIFGSNLIRATTTISVLVVTLGLAGCQGRSSSRPTAHLKGTITIGG